MDVIVDRVAPKVEGTYDREISLDRAHAKLESLRRRYAITRVADVTHLDRIGIPVIAAIVPGSADGIGVYNGKGRSKREAVIGAVMEATERQVAAQFRPSSHRVRAAEIARSLDLAALNLFPRWTDEALECVDGVNLLDGSTLHVPIALVASPWYGESYFPWTHTSGLASGATFLEAVYHGLMELVERHVWSLAHIRASVIPMLLRSRDRHDDDMAIGEEVVWPTGDSEIDALCGMVTGAGLRMRLVLLREGELPYVFNAAIIDPNAECIEVAYGKGASLSPKHAAIRAITEAAQSRLTDIQGAREDLDRRAKLSRKRWYAEGPARSALEFASLPDRSSLDLAVDLRAILVALSNIGIRTVAAVELSSEHGISVARIIAPGLESYVVDQRVGAIARTEFTAFVSRLQSHT
ncbi:MAG TPA: YcaO-like family protein [Candidatus Baltobacteraceae bacterium]|nr:YcaO-like family protein [Candidatus Baltobacteraceae bacterium]